MRARYSARRRFGWPARLSEAPLRRGVLRVRCDLVRSQGDRIWRCCRVSWVRRQVPGQLNRQAAKEWLVGPVSRRLLGTANLLNIGVLAVGCRKRPRGVPVRLILTTFFLFGLGVLGGCANQESASTSAMPAKELAMRLCLAYLDGTDRPPDLCQRYAEAIGGEAGTDNQAVIQNAALSSEMLLSMCQATLHDKPTSTAYCKDVYKDTRDETKRLLHFSKSPKGDLVFVTVVIELAKFCILLADQLPGGAPEIGYCIANDREQLFSAIHPGDGNKEDFGALIKRRFPLRTPVASMIQPLIAAGFTCSPAAESGPCRGTSTILGFKKRRATGLGSILWNINWRASTDGLLDSFDVRTTGVSL